MRGLSASLTETKTVPLLGTPRAAAELAFGESDIEVAVDAHHLAGRFHLRAEHGVDLVAEAREREHRLLDADMVGAAGLEVLRLERKAGERFAGHDARGDLGRRHAGHLGDEGHRARGARIDFEHVNVAVLDGVLHVHQAADLERQRQRAGLPIEFGDRFGR